MGRKLTTGADFERMSQARVDEAQALLDAGHWSGAYYVAGYAVELELKGLIVKRLMTSDEFPDKLLLTNVLIHDLAKLIKSAGIEAALTVASDADQALDADWRAAKVWSEEARYSEWVESEARSLLASVRGVLAWVRQQR